MKKFSKIKKPHLRKVRIITKTRQARLKYYRQLKFPKGFLWGTATSAHQIEGDNVYNDWWQWEKHSKARPNSGKACNHYKIYKKDVELIKHLNNNAHRFSVEWSRLEPKEGQFDRGAVRHYRNVLMELKKNGIKPFVTLHHFTNPIWFAEKGGWTKKESINYFNRYVEFIVGELGDLVEFWITVNEPLVYAVQSFLNGKWPPGKKSYWLTFKVYNNLTKAHRRSYKTIYNIYKDRFRSLPKVGIANNCVSLYSYKSHSFHSWFFILVSDWIWNHSFFDLTGKRTHDFIGLNYYFHYRLKDFHFKTFRFFTEAYNEHREMSSVGWEIYPQGIFDTLLDMRKYNLPIYITENGVATDDEYKRARYLVAYVKEVYHAILSGVKVKGYFYWSLLDNFEWEKGFDPRFGLIKVNFKTFERSMGRSARVYSEICKTNSITRRLLTFLGHEKK